MRRAFCLLTLITLGGIALSLSGCATMHTHNDRAKTVPPYEPHNIMTLPLPRGFDRVALLPIIVNPDFGTAESLSNVKSAIVEELEKAKRFEIIQISPDALREIAGAPQLNTLEPWPDSLRQNLRQKQIDGVMVIEITQLKGYEPISIGIKGRLASVEDGQTYWACDELFDAAATQVYSGAKQFEGGSLMQTVRGKLKTEGTVQLSPSKLAKYAAYTLFKTLPGVVVEPLAPAPAPVSAVSAPAISNSTSADVKTGSTAPNAAPAVSDLRADPNGAIDVKK
jgi:hypothetical protein